MNLRSIIKKAGMAVGGLLLACNIGCNSTQSIEANTRFEEARLSDVESRFTTTHNRPKKWQYPLNVLAGTFISGSVHEGSHALATLSMGYKIEEFGLPFMPNDYGRILGFTRADGLGDNCNRSSNEQQAFSRISGTLGDVALIETLNYNLRNGNIAREHQPFWATTSLITRGLLLNNAIQGMLSKDASYSKNDFRGLETVSGFPVELSFGSVLVYTLANWQEIKDEWKAAIGRKFYPDRKNKSRIQAVPINNGLALQYRRHF